jgi:hypothetical protein
MRAKHRTPPGCISSPTMRSCVEGGVKDDERKTRGWRLGIFFNPSRRPHRNVKAALNEDDAPTLAGHGHGKCSASSACDGSNETATPREWSSNTEKLSAPHSVQRHQEAHTDHDEMWQSQGSKQEALCLGRMHDGCTTSKRACNQPTNNKHCLGTPLCAPVIHIAHTSPTLKMQRKRRRQRRRHGHSPATPSTRCNAPAPTITTSAVVVSLLATVAKGPVGRGVNCRHDTHQITLQST